MLSRLRFFKACCVWCDLRLATTPVISHEPRKDGPAVEVSNSHIKQGKWRREDSSFLSLQIIKANSLLLFSFRSPRLIFLLVLSTRNVCSWPPFLVSSIEFFFFFFIYPFNRTKGPLFISSFYLSLSLFLHCPHITISGGRERQEQQQITTTTTTTTTHTDPSTTPPLALYISIYRCL